MKKLIVTALLFVSVMFSITACGNNASNNTEKVPKKRLLS